MDTTTTTTTTTQIRNAWDALAPRFDEHMTPRNLALGERALERLDIGAGTRVLDVAAGSGALSIPAARRGADVLGIDLSPAMIDRLDRRARSEGLTTLTARAMDGTALDLADDTFDLAVSLHGVSVFPDMAGGLAEMVRVTRPGGRVLVIAFGPVQQAEFLGFLLRAVQAAVPGITPPPMNPPPLPFQASDPALLTELLTGAGLSGVNVETITAETPFRSADDLFDSVTSSHPLPAGIVARLSAEQQDEVRAVLAGMLRERSGGQPGAVLHVAVNIGTGIV